MKKSINLNKFNGLERALKDTQKFDILVKNAYKTTAKEIFNKQNPSGLALYTYGSPGRIELVGRESDADIFLVEKRRSVESEKFRELLTRKLDKFNFSKVDLPPWGTFDEVETYLKKSLIEGNQILETRFIIGNKNVHKKFELQKIKFNSIEREQKNFIFNRFYLNQYFRQRVRDNALNIKYCHGGTRDLLFVSWYERYIKMLDRNNDSIKYEPRVKTGLKKLEGKGIITKKELERVIKAINFYINFRSDVLKINDGTSDNGLTFLDDKTLHRLTKIGYPSPLVPRENFEMHRDAIKKIIELVWLDFIERTNQVKGGNWINKFISAYDSNTSKSVRSKLISDDPLINIALIWGASESKQKELFENFEKKYKNSTDWATIGSIVCSPLCSPKTLHNFGTGQAKERGYGYLLRIIARNRNVSNQTLKSIADDGGLEQRYKEVARAALDGGNKNANNQV